MNDLRLSEPAVWTRKELLRQEEPAGVVRHAVRAGASTNGWRICRRSPGLHEHALAADDVAARLGKSYTPTAWNSHIGHGLNRYRTSDEIIKRNSRFVWDMAPSVVDGRPALVMHYSAFANWGAKHDLIDEVRAAGPGVWLGIYHTASPVPGFTPRLDGPRFALEVFVLTGPIAPFVPAEAD